MKVCEYCGAKVTDEVIQCNSCGSKEFKNICLNCGTTFNGNSCPNCGVMIGDKPRTCFNCGKKTYAKVCPDCGADLTNRKKVQVNTYPILQTKPKKKRRSHVGLIVFIFIIGFFGVLAISNPEDVSSSKETMDRNLTYIELLTLEGHPIFYGDYNEAKKLWKGYDDVKVVNARQTMYNEDALLLITTGDSDKDAITNVTINLSNIDNKKDLNLDKVLQLVCEYIPYNIIDRYYTLKEAFHETFKNGDYEAYHYVMVINDKGKAVNKTGEKHYEDKFAFKIIHRNNDDWIAEMNYLSYKGNHDKYRPDAYEVEDWDVNIEKYK